MALALLIDFLPQTIFNAQSMDRQALINNVVALAKSANARLGKPMKP